MGNNLDIKKRGRLYSLEPADIVGPAPCVAPDTITAINILIGEITNICTFPSFFSDWLALPLTGGTPPYTVAISRNGGNTWSVGQETLVDPHVTIDCLDVGNEINIRVGVGDSCNPLGYETNFADTVLFVQDNMGNCPGF